MERDQIAERIEPEEENPTWSKDGERIHIPVALEVVHEKAVKRVLDAVWRSGNAMIGRRAGAQLRKDLRAQSRLHIAHSAGIYKALEERVAQVVCGLEGGHGGSMRHGRVRFDFEF